MKILVVVDMQKDFITGPLGNLECVATIPQVVAAINSDYDKIFVTKDTHTSDYMNTQEGRKLPVPHCIKGTEGWDIVPEVVDALAPYQAKITYVEKPTFGSTCFGKLLTEYEENQKELVIDFVGVCTGICVISNAMIAKATLPEATIRIIEKACACVTPDSHSTALAAMKLCQMEII